MTRALFRTARCYRALRNPPSRDKRCGLNRTRLPLSVTSAVHTTVAAFDSIASVGRNYIVKTDTRDAATVHGRMPTMSADGSATALLWGSLIAAQAWSSEWGINNGKVDIFPVVLLGTGDGRGRMRELPRAGAQHVWGNLR